MRPSRRSNRQSRRRGDRPGRMDGHLPVPRLLPADLGAVGPGLLGLGQRPGPDLGRRTDRLYQRSTGQATTTSSPSTSVSMHRCGMADVLAHMERDNWAIYGSHRSRRGATRGSTRPCIYWPAPAPTPVTINGSGINNALLIDETLDAATPFEGSVRSQAVPAPRSCWPSRAGPATRTRCRGPLRRRDDRGLPGNGGAAGAHPRSPVGQDLRTLAAAGSTVLERCRTDQRRPGRRHAGPGGDAGRAHQASTRQGGLIDPPRRNSRAARRLMQHGPVRT